MDRKHHRQLQESETPCFHSPTAEERAHATLQFEGEFAENTKLAEMALKDLRQSHALDNTSQIHLGGFFATAHLKDQIPPVSIESHSASAEPPPMWR